MSEEPSNTERFVSNSFGIMFAPSAWTATERLRKFVGPPFKIERDVRRGVNMSSGHIGKVEILVGLASNIAPTLDQDRAELNQQGYTPAIRSKEYAALVETIICSLYSAIDGMRIAIYGAYKGISKVQRGSNGDLFNYAFEKKYGDGFPEEIRTALADAQQSWFPILRKYRTELIHGEVGSCHLDAKNGTITYMHDALGSRERALVVEDIPAVLSRLYDAIIGLTECVYSYLFGQLLPVTQRTLCGFYKGRVYERDVAPVPNLSLNSGECRSLHWFEKEPGFECPLRHQCGAYTNAKAISEKRLVEEN